MSEELYNSHDYCLLAEQYEILQKENAELTADKIHLIQAAMDGGDKYHYTAHDIGYRDLERKVKALEADYIISNRELLILQAEIDRLKEDLAETQACLLERNIQLDVERRSHRWIPVSERLPEKRGAYYVYLSDDFGFRHDMDFFENGDWNSYTVGDVTHWMPLPAEPPSEEEC